MNDRQDHQDPRHPSSDLLSSLIRLAGRRPEVDAERTQRVREAAHAAWHSGLRARRRRRLMGWSLAAAAFVVCAVGVYLAGTAFHQPVARHAVAMAQVVRGKVVIGPERGLAAEGMLSHLAESEEVFAGDWVQTPPGTAASLSLGRGADLRVDEESLVQLVAQGRIYLSRGRLYLDRHAPHPGRIEIVTPLGTITEVGTQFAVAVDPRTLVVSVRDGWIRLRTDSGTHEATRGMRLTAGIDGQLVREMVDPAGKIWDWIVPLAVPFDMEGASLFDLLDWVSRETGLALIYGDEPTARVASQTVLHGQLPSRAPLEALKTILPTTGFTTRRRDGTLEIHLNP